MEGSRGAHDLFEIWEGMKQVRAFWILSFRMHVDLSMS
jgi:hypothetical protein